VEVVTSLSQGRTAAAQCGLFTYKSVPVIFEPPCALRHFSVGSSIANGMSNNPFVLFTEATNGGASVTTIMAHED